MTYQEIQHLERWEVVMMLISSKLICYNLKLDKVTMRRKYNKKGQFCADFQFYMTDRNGYLHIERHRVFGDYYIWICTALTHDFPDTEFIDYTDEDMKLVKSNE